MQIINEHSNVIVLEFFRFRELESKVEMFLSENTLAFQIERIRLHNDESHVLIKLSEDDGEKIRAFLVDAFRYNDTTSSKIDSFIKPLEIKSDDGHSLKLSYSCYGEPYVNGISFTLDKAGEYNSVISSFAQSDDIYRNFVKPAIRHQEDLTPVK
tara:strand:- start:756 stop:1220 length:465 start_codon:yes stop_codon:yes gene_type:complete